MALSFQEADGCNSVWYDCSAQTPHCIRYHVHVSKPQAVPCCYIEHHARWQDVALHAVYALPSAIRQSQCTLFSINLTGTSCHPGMHHLQSICLYSCQRLCTARSPVCLGHDSFVTWRGMKAVCWGCRRQIVEVQSHDYDKHPDSESHFSNGEHGLMTSVYLLAAKLGPMLTMGMVSWPMHVSSCCCQMSNGSSVSMSWTQHSHHDLCVPCLCFMQYLSQLYSSKDPLMPAGTSGCLAITSCAVELALLGLLVMPVAS